MEMEYTTDLNVLQKWYFQINESQWVVNRRRALYQINFAEQIDVSKCADRTSIIKQVITIINLALFHSLFSLSVDTCHKYNYKLLLFARARLCN